VCVCVHVCVCMHAHVRGGLNASENAWVCEWGVDCVKMHGCVCGGGYASVL